MSLRFTCLSFFTAALTVCAMLHTIPAHAQASVYGKSQAGIGTSAPLSALDIVGGAAIGASYAGVMAAPTNGTIVQGNVGIGTNSPASPLSIYAPYPNSTALSITYPTNSWASQAYGSSYRFIQTVIVGDGNSGQKTFAVNGFGVGIGTSPPAYNSSDGLYVLGAVGINMGNTTNLPYTLTVNGSVAGTSAYNNTSDARLKKNIEPIAYGLGTVMQLHPVGFDWIDQSQDWKKQHQLGLIAQEVAPIVPEVVTIAKDKMHTRSLAYGELVPVLIKAVQELQAENDRAAVTISDLITRVQTLEATRQ